MSDDKMFIVTPIAVEVTLNAVIKVKHNQYQFEEIQKLAEDIICSRIVTALDYVDLDFDVSDFSILEVRDQEESIDYDINVTGVK